MEFVEVKAIKDFAFSGVSHKAGDVFTIQRRYLVGLIGYAVETTIASSEKKRGRAKKEPPSAEMEQNSEEDLAESDT